MLQKKTEKNLNQFLISSIINRMPKAKKVTFIAQVKCAKTTAQKM